MDNYQNTLLKLHKEILRWITLANYQKAANKLGVIVNNKIQLQKNEQDIFSDFNIYEEIEYNKRIVSVFSKEYKAKTEIEELVINGMKDAYNSLYLIKKIDTKTHQLKLQDLLNNKDYYFINDEDLSKKCKVKTILFTRLIRVNDYYFTSVLQLLFKTRYKSKLLKEFNKSSLCESDDTHRFINIFHLHRKSGIIL